MATATLKIFLSFGDPKRLRTAELSNWTGKAVVGPRSEFNAVLQRDEAQGAGVYFLTGVNPRTNKKAIYIGEAECIRDRVKAHLSKDFWNTITFFVSKDENLTKAHVRYLEGRLIEIALATQRVEVENEKSSRSKLPESDREDMEIFLAKMQQVLPVLGIEAFLGVDASLGANKPAPEPLTCAIKGITAHGHLTPDGLLVHRGSQAVLMDRPAAKAHPTTLARRHELIADGTLSQKGDAYEFQKDVEFTSPSAAAVVIQGGSANGLTAWVNARGVSLKHMQTS